MKKAGLFSVLNLTHGSELKRQLKLVFFYEKSKRRKQTCEELSKVLLQLHRLVKDFISLLVRLPLVHIPEKQSACLVATSE